MTVFITRDLTENSPFARLLSDRDIAVTGRSLVQIRPAAFADIPSCEWIFFTSSNGVRYFFNRPSMLALPVRWAVLGPATAAAFVQIAGKLPDFCGDGDPSRTALRFKAVAIGSRVLFPGAARRATEIHRHLEPDVPCTLLTVYQNEPVPDPPPSDADWLVFTSPMNVEAWFAEHRPSAGQRVAAIGPSTAAALAEQGVAPVYLPEEPTEAALASIIIREMQG